MPTYTVAKAKDQLSKLINEALSGKPVTITRHGQPVVELHPSLQRPRPMTAADRDELASLRESLPHLQEPAVDVLRRMRDDEDSI